MVSLIATALLIGVRFPEFKSYSGIVDWGGLLLSIAVVLGSISLLAFFVSKNNLTGKNGYKIMFFVILMAIIPESLSSERILLSNLFILLAMRRVYSLRTYLRLKKKLFDAGFWIALAALCYFGSVLFYGWIFVGLVLYSIDQFKNWIIPILAAVAVAILWTSYYIITTNTFGDYPSTLSPPNVDFTAYNNLGMIIWITIIFSLGLWAAISYFVKLRDKPKVFRSSHLLVIYGAVIALIIIIISPFKTGSEFLFLFAPLSIIMTNFLEKVTDKWFAELYVWLLILTPVVILVLNF